LHDAAAFQSPGAILIAANSPQDSLEHFRAVGEHRIQLSGCLPQDRQVNEQRTRLLALAGVAQSSLRSLQPAQTRALSPRCNCSSVVELFMAISL
jgi:hypothetical protein